MISFEQICEDNYQRIYKYIWAMRKNTDDALDLTQEVFVIAYQKGERFLNHPNPEAFLYKTAKNLVHEQVRREIKEEKIKQKKKLQYENRPDAFESLCQIYDSSIIEQDYIPFVLNQLTPKKRLLYTEYYIQKKAMKDIAKEQQISNTTLRMQYVRLRKEMKAIVKNLQLNEI